MMFSLQPNLESRQGDRMMTKPRRVWLRGSKFDSKIAPLLRLWILRILVPLGGYRKFVQSTGFSDDDLAEALDLGDWSRPEMASLIPLQRNLNCAGSIEQPRGGINQTDCLFCSVATSNVWVKLWGWTRPVSKYSSLSFSWRLTGR